MTDVQIVAKGATAPPLDYQLAGALEVVLRVVRAVYDGSGAGAAYLPTIQILSPARIVVGNFPVDSSVAAGASADVTWFPRAVAHAAAPSTSGAQRCQVGIAGTFTIGAGAGVDIPWDTILLDDSGGAMFTLATPTKLFAPTTGIYTVAFQVVYGPSALTDHPVWACIHSDGSHGTFYRQNNAPSLGYDQNLFVSDVLKMAAGDHIRMRAINSGGGAFPIGAGTPSTLYTTCTLAGPL